MDAAELTQDMTDKKRKALTTAITQIERSYGKGPIMRPGPDGIRSWIAASATGATKQISNTLCHAFNLYPCALN